MSCLRCGQCCFPYSLALGKDEDARRWLIYHGLIVRDGPEDHMSVHGHSRCEMLLLNGDGTTSCAVYEDRPQLCKNFACARAQERKDTNGD